MNPILEEARSIYRDEGFVSMMSAGVAHAKHRLGFSEGYQKQRQTGNEQRWSYIEPYLSDSACVLDIGCNEGVLTAKAAEKTGFAIGIEPTLTTVRRAKKQYRDNEGVGFIRSSITPGNISFIPACDTVFLLSVYHVWHAQFGAEKAKRMLSVLSEQTDSTIFFEAASRSVRYEDPEVSFTDFDENEIVEFQTGLLTESLTDEWDIEYLGKSERKRGSEGFRCLFAAHRTTNES